MVDIQAFRAIRYDSEKAGPLSELIAPPYDVISPAQQDQIYGRSPNNIIRVDLNKAEEGDLPLSRYHRAGAQYRSWLASGVLTTDRAPTIYVLSQTFKGPDGLERTRSGFFARARLSRYGEGPIMPHERTLRGPKVDRLELFRATRANLSPIFGAFSDRDNAVRALLAEATRGQPIGEATMDGTKNRLWAVSDPSTVETLSRLFQPKKLTIADGHHRYETALAYRDERRAKAVAESETIPDRGSFPGYEYVLMFSAAMEDPGMVIFPTHRLVHGLPSFDEAAVHQALSTFFDLDTAPADAASAQRALKEAGSRGNAYLMLTAGQKKLLVAKPNAPWSSVPALPEHPALRSLDVSVLHAVVLEQVLGISREAQATQANLRYSKDFAEAFASTSTGQGVQAAFLMNPTKIEEVIAVAESGEVMPQKSTFFYPKLPSGLVIASLD